MEGTWSVLWKVLASYLIYGLHEEWYGLYFLGGGSNALGFGRGPLRIDWVISGSSK